MAHELQLIKHSSGILIPATPETSDLLQSKIKLGAVLVADFKLAERNLELPATLAARCLMALAKAHKTKGAAPTNFMQRGGIEGLVHQCKAVVHERRPIFAGAAALLHLQHP